MQAEDRWGKWGTSSSKLERGPLSRRVACRLANRVVGDFLGMPDRQVTFQARAAAGIAFQAGATELAICSSLMAHHQQHTRPFSQGCNSIAVSHV